MKYKCYYKEVNESKTGSWYGEIKSVRKNANGFEAFITGRGSSFHIIVGSYEFGNYLCIPGWQVGCELAHLSDSFWNQEQLERVLGVVDAITLSNGLKNISKTLTSTEQYQ